MPTNTPLTQTPVPLLTDAANIETATHPGFEKLEQFAIPRFTSTAARNAAFSGNPPSVGQMIHVQSLEEEGYQIWNGEDWEDARKFLKLYQYKDVRASNTDTNSPGFQKIVEIPLLPEGQWRVESTVFFQWLDEDAPEENEKVIFTMEHASNARSRLVGHMVDPEGTATRSNLITHSQTRGGSEYFMDAGIVASETGTQFASFEGWVESPSAGTDLSIRVRKNASGGGEIRLLFGSHVICTRLEH